MNYYSIWKCILITTQLNVLFSISNDYQGGSKMFPDFHKRFESRNMLETAALGKYVFSNKVIDSFEQFLKSNSVL